MRILSKSLKLFLVVLAFGATALYAEEAVSALQSLLNAETNFAEMAAEKGTRDAFLANLSDEAVIFDPGPVNGKKVWLKRESSESKLIWQPIFADVARAGDLGYTTGPWEFKKNASDAKASGYGQFLTVWKKQADGAWKVVLDGGIETPAPTGKPAAAQTPEAEPASSTKRDLKSARRALANAERQFSDASGKDAGAALISAASDGIRVFRAGRFPAVGKDAAQLMLSNDHGKKTATR
jgi:ketosteroid isomerase-like protein